MIDQLLSVKAGVAVLLYIVAFVGLMVFIYTDSPDPVNDTPQRQKTTVVEEPPRDGDGIGVWVCSNCGEHNESTYRYCSSCVTPRR